MTKLENEKSIMSIVHNALGIVSGIMTAAIVSPISAGADAILEKADSKMRLIEKRIMKKMVSVLFFSIGSIFIANALLFLFLEYFGWSKSAAFSLIGIIVMAAGILLNFIGNER